MAKNKELDMEEYFNEGLAEKTEPNNPFEVLEPEPPRKKKASGKKMKAMKRKRILIVAAAALLLVLILAIALLIAKRRNDGARYARKLASGIGQQITAAQKSAGVTLAQESEYATLNTLYASFQGITESRKSCHIEGVKLPQWAIFCNTDAEELTNVTYYNYALLEDSIFGTKRKSYLDPNLVSLGVPAAQVEEQLDLKPYRIQYLQGKQELREYRYCYKDGNSDEIAAYVITATLDEAGMLKEIRDVRRNYIGTLLASPAATES
ncbi:MAG: hypothetical protein IKQ91_05470 [Oscillospiraceae bacterium]|nr:hypothetical protein [Oscillospiraceae bacterium]